MANNTKYSFGQLVELARAERAAKSRRPVVETIVVEGFDRLKMLDVSKPTKTAKGKAGG